MQIPPVFPAVITAPQNLPDQIITKSNQNPDSYSVAKLIVQMEKGLISIDKWSETSKAYFLSHLHADHTKGLSSKWSKGPLFCSPISATLFPTKFPHFDLSLIRVLDVGSSTLISLISPTSGDAVELVVTVVDACHCPGAVMFLFRGEFGCVLYTGDFRWEPTSKRARMGWKILNDSLNGDTIDLLYLDNTYCNPKFSFPTREIATQKVIDIITEHPDHDVIIGIDTLGKEDLLVNIAKSLNIKIWVWPERLRTMHILGLFDTFTTNTKLTRVRAVPRYNVSFETLEALNSLHPTIGIMPSGLPWLNFDDINNGSSNCSGTGQNASAHQYIHSVQYSEHSCFSEIEEFVKEFRSTTITGIISKSGWYCNPRYYFRNIYGDGNISFKLNEEIEVKRKNKRKKLLKTEREMKMKIKAASSSIRKSRICILRRKGHGVKIGE